MQHSKIMISILALLFFHVSTMSMERKFIDSGEKDLKSRLHDIEHSASSLKEKLHDNLIRLDRAFRDFEEFELDVAASKPFALRRGTMSWPVNGALLHAYGSRRISKEAWRGVYISTEPESMVRAPHHGKIIFSDWLKGFGLLMVIEHQQGYMTLYGNNAVLTKSVGEKVRTGEVIAMTGFGSEGHGLYFEIRKNGQPVDPARWFSQK